MKLIIDIPRKVNERLRADYGHGYIPYDEDAKAIMEAIYNGVKPTDEPERKKGKWIRRKKWDKYVCYECSFEHEAVTNYCPNCGADMRGEE